MTKIGVPQAVHTCLQVFLTLGPLWLTLYLSLASYANDYKYCWLTLMGPQETSFGFDDPVATANWYLGIWCVPN